MQTIRLWMVAAIDCASRVILGFKLALAPGAEETVAILQLICQDKTAIAAACGASSGWDQATGVGTIVSDMGSAFTSTAFITAVTDLGWNGMAAAAGHPELRCTIERLFHAFGYLLMSDLTGRLFGSPQERGDYPSEDWAAPTEAELGLILTRFVVDIYHNRAHAGLREASPALAWQALAAESYPLSVPDETTQRAAFGLALTRRPGRHGVRFAGIDYVGRQLLLHSSSHRDLSVRVDPEDLGWIVVTLDGEWHPLRATNPAVTGLVLADWWEMVLSIRRKHRDAVAAETIWRARRDIAAINAGARARHRLGLLKISAARVESDERALYMGLRVQDGGSLGTCGDLWPRRRGNPGSGAGGGSSYRPRQGSRRGDTTACGASAASSACPPEAQDLPGRPNSRPRGTDQMDL